MSRDLRQYARQTTSRILVGFIILLFVVGDGLIYLVYGARAAILGFICLVAGLAPLLLIWLALLGLEWIVKKSNEGS